MPVPAKKNLSTSVIKQDQNQNKNTISQRAIDAQKERYALQKICMIFLPKHKVWPELLHNEFISMPQWFCLKDEAENFLEEGRLFKKLSMQMVIGQVVTTYMGDAQIKKVMEPTEINAAAMRQEGDFYIEQGNFSL